MDWKIYRKASHKRKSFWNIHTADHWIYTLNYSRLFYGEWECNLKRSPKRKYLIRHYFLHTNTQMANGWERERKCSNTIIPTSKWHFPIHRSNNESLATFTEDIILISLRKRPKIKAKWKRSLPFFAEWLRVPFSYVEACLQIILRNSRLYFP